MSIGIAALAASLLLAAAGGPAAPSANPVATFLRAADNNDFSTMEAVSDGDASAFFTKIANCYLRRVYQDAIAHNLVAVWMCAESPSRSRVVLARIALTPNQKVAISVQMDSTNDRPAPGRTGSAFGP
jgi:hypothetical protein